MANYNAPINAMDYTGQKFGMLTVTERVESNKRGERRFLCMCDCGTEVVVLGANLRAGKTKSCGCARKNHAIALGSAKLQDLEGATHGFLQYIRDAERDGKKRKIVVLCRACGKEKVMTSDYFTSARVGMSCGCMKNVIS